MHTARIMSGDGLALLAQRLQDLQDDGVKLNPATANPGELLGRGDHRRRESCRSWRRCVWPLQPAMSASRVCEHKHSDLWASAELQGQMQQRWAPRRRRFCYPVCPSWLVTPPTHPPSTPFPQRPWASTALR